ncbi:MAG TPA: hypothetical protein EYG03_26205 [Planctomycetes bacterium]|nr:hypothetical protein [Fuerstiella sp.]HIK95454.1 hypothetical protein [Planctomycetota bacterium]
MKHRHVIIGVLFWAAAACCSWYVLRTELTAQSSDVSQLSSGVTRWLSGQYRHSQAACDYSLMIAVGDPVFLQSENGTWRQVGLATNINGQFNRDPVASKTTEVLIYEDAVAACGDRFQLQYHTTPMSLDRVVMTMIPVERQKEITRLIANEWQAHQEEIMGRLRPVMKEGLRRGMKAVEAELPQILRDHREQFRKLGDRYETEILKAEVLPLVRDEILPIIEDEALPVAEEVGRALWKRVSLLSFTYSFLYDKSPLPKRDALRAEFQRFIDEVALPELRSRSDQFLQVTEDIVKRSMENPRVKDALKRNLRRVAEDPEFHELIKAILREAIVDNQTLRLEIEAYRKDQETRAALGLAGERLEPVVREIGDLIFGTPESGITPEFSRILRSQILKKDRRWFVMVPIEHDVVPGEPIEMVYAETPMIYPMGFGGHDQSPLTPPR